MKEAPPTKMLMLYSELMLNMKTDNYSKPWSEEQLMKVKYSMEQFKISLVRTFSDHCNFQLYLLNFHLLYQVVADLWEFGTLLALDTSMFEQYNLNLNRAYRQFQNERIHLRMKQ